MEPVIVAEYAGKIFEFLKEKPMLIGIILGLCIIIALFIGWINGNFKKPR